MSAATEPAPAPEVSAPAAASAPAGDKRRRIQTAKVVMTAISPARVSAILRDHLAHGGGTTRLSSQTPTAVATLLDASIKELVDFGFSAALKMDKHCLEVCHFFAEGSEGRLYSPFTDSLPAFHGYSPENEARLKGEISAANAAKRAAAASAKKAKEEAAAAAAAAAAAPAARPRGKKAAPATASTSAAAVPAAAATIPAGAAPVAAAPADTVSAEAAEPAEAAQDGEEEAGSESADHGKRSFQTYISMAVDSVKKGNPEYKPMRCSQRTRQFLDELAIEMVARISNTASIFVASAGVHTMSPDHIMSAARQFITDAGRDDDFGRVKEAVDFRLGMLSAHVEAAKQVKLAALTPEEMEKQHQSQSKRELESSKKRLENAIKRRVKIDGEIDALREKIGKSGAAMADAVAATAATVATVADAVAATVATVAVEASP